MQSDTWIEASFLRCFSCSLQQSPRLFQERYDMNRVNRWIMVLLAPLLIFAGTLVGGSDASASPQMRQQRRQARLTQYSRQQCWCGPRPWCAPLIGNAPHFGQNAEAPPAPAPAAAPEAGCYAECKVSRYQNGLRVEGKVGCNGNDCNFRLDVSASNRVAEIECGIVGVKVVWINSRCVQVYGRVKVFGRWSDWSDLGEWCI